MSSAWLPRHVLPAPDPLPQPFRMLDKLVSGIVERALDAAEEREGGRHDGAQLPVQVRCRQPGSQMAMVG